MKLYETLEQQLKKEPNFVTDNGELKKYNQTSLNR
jgi:adenine-specific DNA-methyltransferase